MFCFTDFPHFILICSCVDAECFLKNFIFVFSVMFVYTFIAEKQNCVSQLKFSTFVGLK